ncbi:MAG: pyridoxal phosphate-dependent aminotransferase [Candidatus Bathyarchaeia archaeon]
MTPSEHGLVVGVSRSQLRAKYLWKYRGLDDEGISLGLAEIDFDIPEPVKRAIINAVLNGEYHYSPVEGLPDFLQAVVDRWRRFNKVDIKVENVLPIVGAMNGIWLASQVCLNSGDEVLIVTPIYGPILNHMASTGAKVISCPARGGDHHIDLEKIEGKISERTKMIAICNPNNPTGAVYTRSELEGLADIAKRRKIYVFSDELYDTLTYDGREHISIASLPGMEDLTITVNGFTKAYGLSGLRIGYIVAGKEIIAKMRTLNSKIIIHPDVIAQKAAAAAYNECDDWMEALRSHCERMRNILCDTLSRFKSVSCPRSEGTFFAFPDVSKLFKNDVEAALWLEKKYKVRTSAGSGFGEGGEGHLRLNFATTEEIMQEALRRLSEAISEAERNIGL